MTTLHERLGEGCMLMVKGLKWVESTQGLKFIISPLLCDEGLKVERLLKSGNLHYISTICPVLFHSQNHIYNYK
jgi:hypothetical protein